MTALAKVFAFLNVTEMFRGVFPDFREKGFAYRNLSVRGEARNGKFTLKEAVLVAPFRTVDPVAGEIPVLGYILGGTRISVPVRVKGDIRDPRVTTMEAAHVGSSLLGIAERTLKTPVRPLSPILPEKGKKAAEGATP